MTNLSIAWSPLVPWWVVAALALVAVLAIGLALWQRASGVGWRTLFALFLLLVLANPAAVSEQRDALKDVALVLVDRSPSQRLDERLARTDAALAGLLERLGRLPDSEVRVVETRGAGAERGAGGTRLFSALGDALGEISRERLAAVFLITDGQVHDAPASLEGLHIAAPLHLLLTGRPGEGDRRLKLSQVPTYGIVGKKQSLTLRVDDLPGGASGTADLSIAQDGGPPRHVTVPLGREVPVEFELDHRGATVIEIEVEAGPRELSLINNRAAISVNGVRDRLRVLLVSGEPHPGERAWRNILKSDPSVDLVHFTILRPPEKQDGTPIRELSLIAFPTRELFEVKLSEFDLIIFDRYRRRGVLPTIYLGNVADYVEQGGALLEAAGPTFAAPLSLYRTPLGRVLPAPPTGEIIEGAFKPRVSELGERHPVTSGLPGGQPAGPKSEPSWGRWFRLMGSAADRGDVLMTGARGLPLLVLERIGKGRVAQLLSDQIWLWARGFEGGGPQPELVRRIAHWLMKEPDLEEEDLRARVEGERLEVRRRSLSEDLPPIIVTGPDGSTEELKLEPSGPGVARAVMPVEEAGLYRVSDGARIALAAAGAPNRLEFEDLRATTAKLAPLVAESGGGEVLLADAPLPELRKVRPDRDRAGRGWLGVVERGAYLVTGVERLPLLPAGLVLLLLLAALILAWRREGR